jgi:hypothetical protein
MATDPQPHEVTAYELTRPDGSTSIVLPGFQNAYDGLDGHTIREVRGHTTEDGTGFRITRRTP